MRTTIRIYDIIDRYIDSGSSLVQSCAHDLAEDVSQVLPGDLGVGLEVVERHRPAAAV
jgi:hypothetical protein